MQQTCAYFAAETENVKGESRQQAGQQDDFIMEQHVGTSDFRFISVAYI